MPRRDPAARPVREPALWRGDCCEVLAAELRGGAAADAHEPPAGPWQRLRARMFRAAGPAPVPPAFNPIVAVLEGIRPPPLVPGDIESMRATTEFAAISSLSCRGAARGLVGLHQSALLGDDPHYVLSAWRVCLERLCDSCADLTDLHHGELETLLVERPGCSFARLNRVLLWLQRPPQPELQAARRRDLELCLRPQPQTQFARLVDAAWDAHFERVAQASAKLRALVRDYPFNDAAAAYLAELVGPQSPEFVPSLVAALWLNPTNPLAHRLLPQAPPGIVTADIVSLGDVALRATPPADATLLKLPLWRYDDMESLGMPTGLPPLTLLPDAKGRPTLVTATGA